MWAELKFTSDFVSPDDFNGVEVIGTITNKNCSLLQNGDAYHAIRKPLLCYTKYALKYLG